VIGLINEQKSAEGIVAPVLGVKARTVLRKEVDWSGK
jgi:hypothetical protein